MLSLRSLSADMHYVDMKVASWHKVGIIEICIITLQMCSVQEQYFGTVQYLMFREVILIRREKKHFFQNIV